MKKLEFYIDVDGVLADFVNGALFVMSQAGYSIPDGYVPTSWNFFKDFGVSSSQFWRMIDGGLDTVGSARAFWSSLALIEDGHNLVKSLKDAGANISFLSSPSYHPECWSAKIAWLYRHDLSSPQDQNIILRQNKWGCCSGPHCILIDDSIENCDKWAERGGTAYLWSQPWNDSQTPHQETIRSVCRRFSESQFNLSAEIGSGYDPDDIDRAEADRIWEEYQNSLQQPYADVPAVEHVAQSESIVFRVFSGLKRLFGRRSEKTEQRKVKIGNPWG